MSSCLITKYLVKPSSKVHLSEWETEAGDHITSKKATGTREPLRQKLVDLQYLLNAGHQHKVLVILQGIDTAGKDGTIRHVFEGVNPQIVDVSSFKVPTREELDHDFLWRVHRRVPGKGEIMIFNRSHYEDVLAVRVHNLVPRAVWEKRFGHINDFERMLSDEGTLILKFFLHITAGEQRKRLRKRLEDPKKLWKFSPADLKERALWPDYTRAFEDVLTKTSTSWAPWYIIPADDKWYRDLVVSSILVDSLEGLDMKYPQPALSGRDMAKILKELKGGH